MHGYSASSLLSPERTLMQAGLASVFVRPNAGVPDNCPMCPYLPGESSACHKGGLCVYGGNGVHSGQRMLIIIRKCQIPNAVEARIPGCPPKNAHPQPGWTHYVAQRLNIAGQKA